jgi:hypothetical protein
MSLSPQVFSPLLGRFVFDAKKGHGSFVTFSLTSTPEAPIEEFYFWVYMCEWEIREAGNELAHSESEDDELNSAVSAMNGRKLEAISFHSWLKQAGLKYGATLRFERGLVMKLCQYEDSSPDWDIFKTKNSGTGKWTSYFSDGTIKFERSA